MRNEFEPNSPSNGILERKKQTFQSHINLITEGILGLGFEIDSDSQFMCMCMWYATPTRKHAVNDVYFDQTNSRIIWHILFFFSSSSVCIFYICFGITQSAIYSNEIVIHWLWLRPHCVMLYRRIHQVCVDTIRCRINWFPVSVFHRRCGRETIQCPTDSHHQTNRTHTHIYNLMLLLSLNCCVPAACMAHGSKV